MKKKISELVNFNKWLISSFHMFVLTDFYRPTQATLQAQSWRSQLFYFCLIYFPMTKMKTSSLNAAHIQEVPYTKSKFKQSYPKISVYILPLIRTTLWSLISAKTERTSSPSCLTWLPEFNFLPVFFFFFFEVDTPGFLGSGAWPVANRFCLYLTACQPEGCRMVWGRSRKLLSLHTYSLING